MGEGDVKRAAEMLLAGATMMAQPCPYCSGVRVMKDGRALCASCGSEPEREGVDAQPVPSVEQRVLDLTRQLGAETDPDLRKEILDAIARLSAEMASGAGGAKNSDAG